MKKATIYFGRNPLKEALMAKVSISTIYVETSQAYEFAKALTDRYAPKVVYEEKIPNALQKESHQGIAFKTLHSLYEDYDANLLDQHSFIILCNHIEDVHNLGSISRSAAAFGSKFIIHEKTKSASMTPAAVKSSAGCAFRQKFAMVDDLTSVIRSLKKRGFQIAGLDASKQSIALYDWKPVFPLALVLGSEGSGIEANVLEACDQKIKIQMESGIDSLNVSHAAALAMSWARNSRFQKP